MKKTPDSRLSALLRLPLLGAILMGAFTWSTHVASADDPVLWGNSYFMGNANSATVNDTRKIFARFTATETVDITAARIYANGSAGSPTIQVSLQGDNGSGQPDGIPLATSSFAPGAQGWYTATFGTAPTLNQGNVYFLVAETSTPSASMTWRVNLNGAETRFMQPFGVADPNWGRGETTTSTTVSAGQSITYLLETDSGRALGQPYVSVPFQNLGSTTTTIGQRFRFDQAAAGGNNLVTGVNLRLTIGATPPVNDLTAVLLDSSFNTLATGSIDLSSAVSGFHMVDFDNAAALSDNALYYIGLFSNGSAGNSIQWSAMETAADSVLQSASFQGDDAYAVSWNAQANFGDATLSSSVYRDYYFQLALIPEPSTYLILIAPLLVILVRRLRKA